MTQHALDDLNEFSAHHLRLRLAETIPPLDRIDASSSRFEGIESAMDLPFSPIDKNRESAALTIRLLPQDGATLIKSELQVQSTILQVYYPSSQNPSLISSSSVLASFIADQLQGLFAEEQAIIEDILTSSMAGTGVSRDLKHRTSKSSPSDLVARLATRRTRALKYAPTYHITVSLFSPSAQPSSWEIESALTEYMMPLLDAMSSMSNFTIDTQVQLHAAFSPSVQMPEYDAESNVWTLREEDLSGFINAAEWPLSPSIGDGPTLNFVVYVPDQKWSPLVVKGTHASSWLIPQWGGVVILDPSQNSNTSKITDFLSKDSIQHAVLTFSHQLLSFLGAPLSPPSLPLQMQALTRIDAASLLLSASSTMGSLARLTVALPSIAIPETVSTAVDETLNHLRQTCNALKEGRFREALENARIAESQAEKGFFEKSMVGQVYFPDEHKVAVYLPLLGPIGVPLVMSALKEIRRRLAVRRGKR